MAAASISSRFKSVSGGGGPCDSCCDCFESGDFSGAGSVALSIAPRLAEEEREDSSVPGGWTGSYSEVASLPASLRIILEPPGCEGRKDVTCM